MKLHRAARVAAVMLASLLPVWTHPAGAESSKVVDTPAASVDEMDLQAVGERIRQTGAQMQEDLRRARARLEAHKAQQEAERRRQAELARQKAEAEQAAIREREQREAAQKQAAESARQSALATRRAKEEQAAKEERAAKEKAAKALKEALHSGGAKAFAEDEL